MPSDLHIHTNFSDGKLTPEEVVSAAKAAGLVYIAITDHDTVDGIRHLYEEGVYPSKAVNIIPGIEFSSDVDGHDVHILGYGFDIYNQEIADKTTDISEARWTRFSEMILKLKELGYPITEADALSIAGTSRSVGRLHVARALCKKGLVPSVREAFEQLLDKGRPAYVPRYRIAPEEAVSLIRRAGGIPVLAHPKLIWDDELAEKILELDFGGMEVYYPRHDAEDTRRYEEMAKRHGLLMTGGSDYHALPQRYPEKLGEFTVDDALAEPFFSQSEAVG